jgi:hypothetical protein
MRIEIHLIDGTIVEKNVATAGGQGDDSTLPGSQRKADPIFNRLRSLRNRARRLGVWFSAVRDTERGIINASLLLRRLGNRMRIILERLMYKLQDILRRMALEGLRKLGYTAAKSLVEFFAESPVTVGLLGNDEYVMYIGVRELFLRNLRTVPL